MTLVFDKVILINTPKNLKWQSFTCCCNHSTGATLCARYLEKWHFSSLNGFTISDFLNRLQQWLLHACSFNNFVTVIIIIVHGDKWWTARECTSQSKSPPPGKGGNIGQKNSKKKGTNVPTLREIFSFQCPCLSPPTIEGMCCGSNFYLVQNVSNQFGFQFFVYQAFTS